MMTAANRLGLYSAFLALSAICLSSSAHARLTVATMFLGGGASQGVSPAQNEHEAAGGARRLLVGDSDGEEADGGVRSVGEGGLCRESMCVAIILLAFKPHDLSYQLPMPMPTTNIGCRRNLTGEWGRFRLSLRRACSHPPPSLPKVVKRREGG